MKEQMWVMNGIPMLWSGYGNVHSMSFEIPEEYFFLNASIEMIFHGLVQDCSDPSALAIELLQSCSKPSI